MNKYFVIEPCDAATRKRIQWIAFSMIAFSIAVIYLTPVEKLFLWLGIETVNGCPIYTFLGIPCPMCGMGRAFSTITDLHFGRTFYYNPSGLILYIVSAFIFTAIIILSFFNKKIILTKLSKGLWYIPLLLLVIVWVLNIMYGHHHR